MMAERTLRRKWRREASASLRLRPTPQTRRTLAARYQLESCRTVMEVTILAGTALKSKSSALSCSPSSSSHASLRSLARFHSVPHLPDQVWRGYRHFLHGSPAQTLVGQRQSISFRRRLAQARVLLPLRRPSTQGWTWSHLILRHGQGELVSGCAGRKPELTSGRRARPCFPL